MGKPCNPFPFSFFPFFLPSRWRKNQPCCVGKRERRRGTNNTDLSSPQIFGQKIFSIISMSNKSFRKNKSCYIPLDFYVDFHTPWKAAARDLPPPPPFSWKGELGGRGRRKGGGRRNTPRFPPDRKAIRFKQSGLFLLLLHNHWRKKRNKKVPCASLFPARGINTLSSTHQPKAGRRHSGATQLGLLFLHSLFLRKGKERK